MNRRRKKRSWPIVRKRTTKVNGHEYSYWEVDVGMVEGRRPRLNFRTKQEAELEAKKLREERRIMGAAASGLTRKDKKDAAEAKTILQNNGTLTTAAEFYVRHLPPGGPTPTVKQLHKEFLAAKERANLRPATIKDIKNKVGRFVKTCPHTKIGHVATHDIEKWLDRNNFSPPTRATYLRYLHGFLEYAVQREYLHLNPAARIQKPRLDQKLPEVMPVKDAERLFTVAEVEVPEIIPYLAIGFFAGLRPTEIQGLDWKDIDLSECLIRVIPEVAKRRRQRFVDISDNLLQWLLPFRQQSGKLYCSRNALETAREKAKVAWAHDIMRHSYASYHLAEHQDAGKTSLQMGHLSPAILFNNYRNLVRPQDPKRFWAIRPKTKCNVTRRGNIAR